MVSMSHIYPVAINGPWVANRQERAVRLVNRVQFAPSASPHNTHEAYDLDPSGGPGQRVEAGRTRRQRKGQ